MSKATARGRAGPQRVAAPRSGAGKGTASRNGTGGGGGWGGSLQLGAGGEPALLPEGTVDAQADIDSILELQRSHGNRVVVQLIAAAEGTASVDLGGRADRLVRAIKFELPWWTIDVPSAAGALDGLGGADVMALSKQVERRLDISLSVIISKARISDAERKQLRTLMQGSGVDRFEGRDVRQVGETAGAFIGNVANLLGADVDPELAGKVSGAAFEATARAAYDAERPEAEAAAATRRFYAQAHDVRALMGRSDKERLFALIGGSHQDRMALADAYAKEYGTSLYNDLTTKLSGKEKDRFQALWAGDKVSAEAAALEAETEQRKKLDAEMAEYGPALKFIGDAGKNLEAKRAEARSKQEQRVETLAATGQLEDVIRRAGPKLEGVIEGDKILGHLRRGVVPEQEAMRLVRAHNEDKLTAAMIEEAQRRLYAHAEAEAQKMLEELNLGVALPLLTPVVTSGFFRRFEQEFNYYSRTGTLAEVITKLGDKVRQERNQALLAQGGFLAPWQELDFALRADPKDMETVKRVLGDLTAEDLEDPTDPEKGVAREYQRNTKGHRKLQDDLMGTSAEQRAKAMFEPDELKVELGERRLWLGANKFVPKATDPIGQIAEEGRWRFNRLAYYERLVMENRGSFAKTRDYIGHIDKTLVDVARTDATDAKGGMERALLEHPPDLMEAARQVTELRLIEQRLQANIKAYQKGTAEAWDEFVSFVAEVVTAIGTGGSSAVAMSFLRKAVITAAKNALYTIGTKLVLDGRNYTPGKLLADLRSAAGGALGSGLSEKFVAPLAEDLAWSVSAWAAKRGLAPGLAGKATEFVVKQEGDVFVGAITTAIATGEDIQGLDPYSQLRGMAVSAGAGKVREGGEAVVKRVRGRRRKGSDPDLGEGSEDLATPTTAVHEAATTKPGEADETAAGPGADVEESAADIEAEMPPVSMALPEPGRPRGRAKPPPIPEAAKRRKPPEDFPEGPGPAEPDDFTSEPDTEQDVRPAGDFESEEDTQRDIHPPVLDPDRQGAKPGRSKPPPTPDTDRIRKPGPRAQGEPERFPPQDWDHQLVIQLHDATDHAASRNLLVEMFGQDPTREVGMYRNTVTGEYILIQGEAAKVSYVPKKGGIEQRWKEILEAHSEVGSWELVTHTHPKGTPFASGARGDFGAIVREGLNSRTARTSEILFPRNDGTGLGKTEFGFDPESAQPYWIKPDGSDQTYTFATLSEYLGFVGVHESVPAWVPRGRVDWSKRGELLKAYEQWAEERRAKERQSQEGPSEPEQGVTTAAEGASSRDEGAPRSGDAAVAGVETADVGAKSLEPVAAGAGKSRSQDPSFDIPGGPVAPSSPRGVSYVNHAWADYDVLERPAEGLSDSYRLRDKATGDIYLFKPAKGEQDVPRAAERGIRKGEQAPRTKATELTANRLGIETPDVELARIGTRPGSLTKWVGLDSLGRLEKSNNALFQEIVKSDEYLALRARIDALDYLTNNLDRNKNFGNYLYELGPDGRTVVRLVPIDHDLTFTTTVPRANLEKYTRDLPTQMTREMAENLVALSRDRAGFQEEIRGLVGDEALPGVIHRLDELLNRAQRLHPDVFQTVGAHP